MFQVLSPPDILGVAFFHLYSSVLSSSSLGGLNFHPAVVDVVRLPDPRLFLAFDGLLSYDLRETPNDFSVGTFSPDQVLEP